MPNLMKYCNKSQIDQGKVLNNGCHITFVLMTSAPKAILLHYYYIITNFFVLLLYKKRVIND